MTISSYNGSINYIGRGAFLKSRLADVFRRRRSQLKGKDAEGIVKPVVNIPGDMVKNHITVIRELMECYLKNMNEFFYL